MEDGAARIQLTPASEQEATYREWQRRRGTIKSYSYQGRTIVGMLVLDENGRARRSETHS